MNKKIKETGEDKNILREYKSRMKKKNEYFVYYTLRYTYTLSGFESSLNALSGSTG